MAPLFIKLFTRPLLLAFTTAALPATGASLPPSGGRRRRGRGKHVDVFLIQIQRESFMYL